MKFFLPPTNDAKLAEETYLQIKANVERDHPGYEISSDRIFAVDHIHNGKRIHSEVGQPDPGNGEMVVAIFRVVGGLFLVCTPNRGVVRGFPMLTSADGTATLFD